MFLDDTVPFLDKSVLRVLLPDLRPDLLFFSPRCFVSLCGVRLKYTVPEHSTVDEFYDQAINKYSCNLIED